jgi:hypothetical protein
MKKSLLIYVYALFVFSIGMGFLTACGNDSHNSSYNTNPESSTLPACLSEGCLNSNKTATLSSTQSSTPSTSNPAVVTPPLQTQIQSQQQAEVVKVNSESTPGVDLVIPSPLVMTCTKEEHGYNCELHNGYWVAMDCTIRSAGIDINKSIFHHKDQKSVKAKEDLKITIEGTSELIHAEANAFCKEVK